MSQVTEEKHEFKTEIKELLHLIIHTLYTPKEIFLRELLSNAADALSKVQFESLTNPNIYDKDQPMEVNISVDKDMKSLTVEDTGIGMSHDELIAQIGTIASSGTRKFMKVLDEAKEGKNKKERQALPDLIGQFGVGFYSVFMVADKVVVETKSIDADAPAVRWESDGEGSYTIAESERRKRGTQITLFLKSDAEDYLNDHRIKNLVKQYSNFIPFPVKMEDEEINTHEALWRSDKRKCKKEDYDEFYKQNCADWQDPMMHLHTTGDAPVQYSAILYTPQRAPMEFYGQNEEDHGLKLYVKRVFIQNSCKELIPKFLRFLKGVVETEDLPLNVSRETIQSDVNITKINKIITKKYLQSLEKMAKKEPEKYQEFWGQFEKYIKEGVHSEYALRDKLLPLLRFHSTKKTDKPEVTLESYVEGKVEDQKAIYYAVGESLDQLRRSPHLELFLKNDIEVLLMTMPMDDMVLSTLGEYKEMKFINVESGDLDLPENLKKEVEEVEVGEDLDKLKEKVKTVLSEKINEVRFSKALTDSPCKFYNKDGGMSHSVRQMMKEMGGGLQMPGADLKRDLELNPEHQFIQALSARLDADGADDQIRMLYHLASLLEGNLEEPQELAGLILPLLK